MALMITLLTTAVSAQAASAVDSGPAFVHVGSGAIAGQLQGSVGRFEGIPFAAPPLGHLRWREPQPVANWSGTRDATHPASSCMQSSAGLDTFMAPLAAAYGMPFERERIKPSEDCLYLNVFAPWPPGEKRLPVMVWLHGGSNRVGTGADESYNGSSLASHGVVLVTLNYRLGVIGFFSHPGLTAESPHHSSGNYGLLDQISGLQWVRQNIGQFGGDPENVTVFGESAGSVDATTLMASPLVKGLFRRVIAESGPAFGLGPPITLVEAEKVGSAVGQAAINKVPTSETAVEALRQMPAERLAELELRVITSNFKNFDPNGAVVDGWLLPQTPAKAFALGKIQKVNLLAGLNGRELSAFRMGAAAAAKASNKPAPQDGPMAAVKKLADTAHPLYDGWTDIAVGVYLAQLMMHGDVAVDKASNDMLVACPISAEASLVTNLGARVFLYQFDRSIPGKGESTLGAFHGLEVPFVFNSFATRSWRWLPFAEADRKLSAIVETYWTNFAKFGDPNGADLPAWRAWNSDEQAYLEFSQNGAVVAKTNFSPPFCHVAPSRLRDSLASTK